MSSNDISLVMYVLGRSSPLSYEMQARERSIARVIYGRTNEVSHYLTHITRNRESNGVRIMINELITTWWARAKQRCSRD